MKKVIEIVNRIRHVGVEYETTYRAKKDLISYNSTFFWTTVLIFVNIFIAYASKIHYVSFINACATVVFSGVLLFNHFGFFKWNKHLGIVLANIYVFFQSLAGGPDLQFQYAYCIILTMIGLVFIQKRNLLIHLPITIMFFILTKISYYYFGPWETIPVEERDLFAFNNGIIFLSLISISAFVFRNQTNLFLNEIEQKKNLIEEKQKEIYDSINYARRIQQAVLTNRPVIDEHLHKDKYFILFRPKDIVSGDFYWATRIKVREKSSSEGFTAEVGHELFYLALCDSTGHGVPGAFMSLLNMGFLDEAIKEKQIYEPNKIFDSVRAKLIKSISNEGQQDGFDGILLCINKNTGQITYSAANNNPLMISGNQVVHLKADKMPVGKGEKNDSFQLFEVSYSQGDKLYMYTDGYADQFGGPKGKKFKYRQLEELLLHSSRSDMFAQKQELDATFVRWKGELEQVDDVCVAGIML